MLWALTTVGNWFRALPGPSSAWASIISSLAWPGAMLIAMGWFREPIMAALHALAVRFRTDDLQIAGMLKVERDDKVIALDEAVAAEEPVPPRPGDVERIDALLDFAGESVTNLKRFEAWICDNVGEQIDPLELLADPRFVMERERAYNVLVGKAAS